MSAAAAGAKRVPHGVAGKGKPAADAKPKGPNEPSVDPLSERN